MRRLSVVSSVLALGMLYGGTALAGSKPVLSLTNSTGYTIASVYIALPGSNKWAKIDMGNAQLVDTKSASITITANPGQCNFDLKIVYDDDENSVWKNINLCSINKITLYWDDAKNQTRAVQE